MTQLNINRSGYPHHGFKAFLEMGQKFLSSHIVLGHMDLNTLQVQLLLDHEQYPEVLKKIQEGYVLNTFQTTQFSQGIKSMLENFKDLNQINTCIGYGLKLTQQEVAQTLIKWTSVNRAEDYMHYTHGQVPNINELKTLHFRQEILKTIVEPGFSKVFLHEAEKFITSGKHSKIVSENQDVHVRSRRIANLFHEVPNLFTKEVSATEFKNFCYRVIKKHPSPLDSHFLQGLNDIIQNHYQDTLEMPDPTPMSKIKSLRHTMIDSHGLKFKH